MMIGPSRAALILDVDSMLRLAAAGGRQTAPELKLAG